ncbi:MAG: hypothetical protein ACXVJW_07180 [Acidimicrobiia bacterium]
MDHRRQMVVRPLRIVIVVLLLVGLGACGSGGEAQIDWVSFVHVRGRTYVQVQGPEPELPRTALGPVVARVRKTLADNVHDPDYRAGDGDASFLRVGTAIHSLAGFAPRFRLAVLLHGRVIVYQADGAHQV